MQYTLVVMLSFSLLVSVKWESIGYLVEALCADNEYLKKLAERYVCRWHSQFNKSFTTPTKAQMERLSGVLERCGGGLDQSIKKLLESTSRSY
jgi:hypothetical protein